ncbi:DEAD/DEAH box helicase [Leptolyngbya sp. FACHB-261]|uniref:DEAD/DEAH box helicase n=1 Tax=Leptolyngbya sp. FACHB-261 TaxID=2692806 RepID=UPI001686B73F|nr:DEAD/DEAH box helicase [Leptolyngbya sp. FACHB-261]MBD2099669.1 DEAD/DEAH box helicase [Leptolyngbya sp. FACHB-261]
MTLSFQTLGLSEAQLRVLGDLGFTDPTPIQVQAIPVLLEGRDVVGQAQTGTGKTAAFGLPLLHRLEQNNPDVQALILTPTRELAIQVAQALHSFRTESRVRVLPVYGGQSIERQLQRLERGVQVVVGTPGRVLDLLERGSLRLNGVRMLVLDEADEMLNMGFLPDVERILSQVPDARQTAFFSATLNNGMQQLIRRYLKEPVNVRVQTPKDAPVRITQVAYQLPRNVPKSRALLPILEVEDPEAAIIFVRTRQAAAELTSTLQAAGHSVDEYHGNLSQSQRERLLSRFRSSQVRWIVATDIAARGLDIDTLTHVVNYDLPDSLESYVHRIGRTGRAGREGRAITLVTSFERYKLRAIERHVGQTLEVLSLPTRAEVEAKNLEKFKTRIQEALSGERLASFLPLVAQLGGDGYDVQAIAAAALQLAYDGNRKPGDMALADELEPEQRSNGGSEGGRPRSSRPVPRVSRRS